MTQSATSSNILIAYFSRVGITDLSGDVDAVSSASINTQDDGYIGNATILANMITEKTGGDLFQIITEENYPTGYRDTTDQASDEKADNARPALSSHVENMNQYDYVFLVYPNWWGTIPMPLFTFLEEYDFSGKTIAPLATHEGSGLGSSVRDIEDLIGGDVTIADGLAVRGGSVSGAQGDVESWIDGLELPEPVTSDSAEISETVETGISEGAEETMKITIGDTEYDVILDENITVTDITSNMPLELELTRYAGHEYYAELPFTPKFASETTSQILAGHVYYWDGWNAFVINYIDSDISPYNVVHVGEIADASISDYLTGADETVHIQVSE